MARNVVIDAVKCEKIGGNEERCTTIYFCNISDSGTATYHVFRMCVVPRSVSNGIFI